MPLGEETRRAAGGPLAGRVRSRLEEPPRAVGSRRKVRRGQPCGRQRIGQVDLGGGPVWLSDHVLPCAAVLEPLPGDVCESGADGPVVRGEAQDRVRYSVGDDGTA